MPNGRDFYYQSYEGQREPRGRGDNAAYAAATAIRWVGIIIVTMIVAYVVLQITGSAESVFCIPRSGS